jgi:hypothetical protein
MSTVYGTLAIGCETWGLSLVAVATTWIPWYVGRLTYLRGTSVTSRSGWGLTPATTSRGCRG